MYYLELYNFRTHQHDIYWPIPNSPRPVWATVQEAENFALNQLAARGRVVEAETGEVQIIEGIEPQRLWSVVNGVYNRGYYHGEVLRRGNVSGLQRQSALRTVPIALSVLL